MPLARIITEHADESVELAIQLRARGFDVETVSPNQIPDTPADLVVELDTCHTNDILARVMEISADSDSFVLVAPGALDERSSQRVLPATEAEWLFARKARRQKEEADRLTQAPALVENWVEPTNGASRPADLRSSIELPTPAPETVVAKAVEPLAKADQAVLPLAAPAPSAEVAVAEPASIEVDAALPITIHDAPGALPDVFIQKLVEPATEPDEPLFAAEMPAALPEVDFAKSPDWVIEAESPITITEAPLALPELAAIAKIAEPAEEADEPLFAAESGVLPNVSGADLAEPVLESEPVFESEPVLEPEPVLESGPAPVALVEEPGYPLADVIRPRPPHAAPVRAARETVVSRSRPADVAFWRICIIAAALAAAVVIVGSAWQQRRPAPGALPAPASQRFPFQKSGTQPAPAKVPAATTHEPAQTPAQTPAHSSSPAAVAPTPPPAATPTQAKPPATQPTEPAVTATKATPKKARAPAHHRAPTHSTDSGRIAEDTVVYYGPRPSKASGSSTTKQ